MLTVIWNVSASIRGYLRSYMPTNIALDRLRASRGVKWAVPAAVMAVCSYLLAMSLCAGIVEHGGPGWLNLLVLLFFWNASKFAWVGMLGLFLRKVQPVNRNCDASVPIRSAPAA